VIKGGKGMSLRKELEEEKVRRIEGDMDSYRRFKDVEYGLLAKIKQIYKYLNVREVYTPPIDSGVKLVKRSKK